MTRLAARLLVLITLWLPAAGFADASAPLAASVTRHTLSLPDGPLPYTVTVDALPVPEEGGPTAGHIVYVGYTRDGAEPRARPVTFAVNGGPGAASAFLQLGGLGPERLAFDAEGWPASGAPRLEPNPLSWLAFTDLVFLDPVGTGLSRVAEPEGDRAPERGLWNVRGDLDALAGAIRQWALRHGRWASPKILVGESYGGFRMAALAERLPRELEVGIDGVILVSPALELSLQQGVAWDLLPWVLRVPSMAAVARVHGKAPGGLDPHPRAALAEVEAWALGPLLNAVARGAALPEADRSARERELAAVLGLPPATLAREGLRVDLRDFAEHLLEAEGRLPVAYDGSVTVPRSAAGQDDGYLTRFAAALAAAMAERLRTDLAVETRRPYLVLNREVFRSWGWEGERGRRPGAAADLARALVAAPDLRVLVAHGAFDLVTPYFTSVYLMDQLVADTAARRRLKVAVYPGGHMFYSRDASLAAFTADAASLVAEILAATPGG